MSYILTASGNNFYYTDIRKENISIDDVFQSLPRLNRFVGHSARAYSVGEHSIYCEMMANKLGFSTRERLLTLIHDFTEAYVGDCPAPLKRLLPEFDAIEKEVELAICKHLEIEPPTEEEHLKVKSIDLTMLVLEMKYLTNHDYNEFVNELTHKEFISNKEFDLTRFNPNENEVRESIKYVFNNLIKEYRG